MQKEPDQYMDRSLPWLGTWVGGQGKPICWNHDTKAQNILQNALTAATCLGLISLAETMIVNGTKDSRTYFGTSLIFAVKQDEVNLTVLLLEIGALSSPGKHFNKLPGMAIKLCFDSFLI